MRTHDRMAILTGEEHAGAAVFLALDESSYVTEHVTPIEWFGRERPSQ